MCKDDKTKPRVDLVDPQFIIELGKILQMGADKYAPESWKQVPDAANRYYAAAMRHLLAYQADKAMDAESGMSHLVHAACNLMFLRWFERKDTEETLSKIKELDKDLTDIKHTMDALVQSAPGTCPFDDLLKMLFNAHENQNKDKDIKQ